MAYLWARDIFTMLIINDQRGFEDAFLLTRNSPLDIIPLANAYDDSPFPSYLLPWFLPHLGRARVFHSRIGRLDDWRSISNVLSTVTLPHLEELICEWQDLPTDREPETCVRLAAHPKLRLLKTAGFLAYPSGGNNITSIDIGRTRHSGPYMPS